ncbi:hypothetical protein [Cellulomonas sp. ATA003]|uniref:hypothetical protein n=1 Tax=Cellulomonas sp. ATA003 TaxID=3073064 RepID=UPI002872AC95|nr:hypothetical protein [Cellulomonas sp. ATA003]WNB84614.1 hypothetical protein REH70_12420 [Cellulomonas sp. ATA003]
MRTPVTDVRLVPAALACWGTCGLAVRLPTVPVGVVGATLVIVAVVLAVGRAVRSDGSPRSSRPGSVGVAGSAGHVVLVLAVCGSALGSVAMHRTARETGLLAELVAERAQVRVVGTVRSAPVPLRSTAAWGGDEDRYRVDLAVEQVSGRGRTGPAAAPVLVLAGAPWSGVAYGTRVQALGTLEPTAGGDDAVALLVVRGPPTTVTEPGRVHAGVATVRRALLDVSDGLLRTRADSSPARRSATRPGSPTTSTRRCGSPA